MCIFCVITEGAGVAATQGDSATRRCRLLGWVGASFGNIKLWLIKHEDPSSDSQHLYKKAGGRGGRERE